MNLWRLQRGLLLYWIIGANINAQTEETQETALTLACCGGFTDVADFLIKAGADIELGASTPLMEAAQEGHLELVKYEFVLLSITLFLVNVPVVMHQLKKITWINLNVSLDISLLHIHCLKMPCVLIYFSLHYFLFLNLMSPAIGRYLVLNISTFSCKRNTVHLSWCHAP